MKRFLLLSFGFFGGYCFFTLFVGPLVKYLYSGEFHSSLSFTGDDAAMAASLAEKFLWAIIFSVMLPCILVRYEKCQQKREEDK